MRLALVAVTTIGFLDIAQAADAPEKTCVQLEKQYVGMSYAWDLDKVHKIFGQPSRIDRAAYKDPYDKSMNDVLVFDFTGCYFFAYVDKAGKVFSTREFHFRPSELLGKTASTSPPQRTEVDAIYATIQTLETRLKNLEASEGHIRQLQESVTRLESAIRVLQVPPTTSNTSSRSPAPRAPILPPVTPKVQEYLGIGSGHWIEDVSSNGRIIELEDGSLWEISSSDQLDTALWLPITDISVQKASSPIGEYKYILVNKEDGEKALAKLLGKN